MLAIALALACVVVLVVSAQALGALLLARLSFSSPAERLAMTSGVGLGALGVIAFLLGLTGALSPIVILLGSAALAGSALSRVGRIRLRAPAPAVVVAICIAVVVAGAAWLALYPPTAFDATMYHLRFAKRFARTHSIAPLEWARVPVFPVLDESLFAVLWMFGGDLACQLLQTAFYGLCALTAYAWASRLTSPAAGWLAAGLALHSPMMGFLASTAYIDLAPAVFVALAVFAVTREGDERGWLRAAGALAGFAAAVKYTGLLFAAALGVWVAIRAARVRRFSPLVDYAGVAAAVALPFYSFIYFHSGDPIFPYLFESNSYWSADDVAGLREVMRSYGSRRDPGHLLTALLDVERHARRFNVEAPFTSIYFYGLPLAVAAAALERRLRVTLALAIGFVVVWFYSFQMARYLTVVVPLLAVLTAVGFARVLAWRRIPSWLSTAAALIATIAVLIEPADWMRDRRRALGALPTTPREREQYLRARMPPYHAISLLNQTGQPYRLYSLGFEYLAYFADGEFIGDQFGAARYSRIRERANDAAALHAELRSLGATHFLVPAGEFAELDQRFRVVWSTRDHRLYEIAEP